MSYFQFNENREEDLTFLERYGFAILMIANFAVWALIIKFIMYVMELING